MSQAPTRSRQANKIDLQIMALFQAKEEERLAQGRLSGNRDEDHQPVYFLQTGGIRTGVGCSCGHRAKQPNRRVSTMFNSFAAHLRSLGLARRYYYNPRYSFGPAKGLTWNEGRAQGIQS